ncbi:hypothetical protein BGZ90_002627 [Linnemannia elongata]|nr:hypothetical protein BGZ90_002627 [Linnemannia elongata]
MGVCINNQESRDICIKKGTHYQVGFIHPHEDPLICPIATYQCYVAQLASSTLTSVKHLYLDQTLNPLIRYMFDINQATSSDTIGRHITKVSDPLPLPRAWKRRRLVALLTSPLPLSMFSTSQSSYADGEQSTLIKNLPILNLDPVLNKRMVVYQMIWAFLAMSSPLRT